MSEAFGRWARETYGSAHGEKAQHAIEGWDAALDRAIEVLISWAAEPAKQIDSQQAFRSVIGLMTHLAASPSTGAEK